MDAETRRKIEETVIDILKKASMEEMTECKVRMMASESLGIDLSEKECKLLVRSVVENFLLSEAQKEEEGKEVEPNAREETTETAQKVVDERPKKEVGEDGDRIICKLSNKRNVVIHDFRGKTLVSIREYYQKNGKQLPTARGISLSNEQWSAFRRNIPAIEEAIRQMESRLSEQVVNVSMPENDFAPPEIVSFETGRFDGKNYHHWAQQVYLYLEQLKIAYVLTDPCPSVLLGPETSTEEIAEAKFAEQKWMNDDYICRRNIVSSLSDHLFHQYSKKSMNAKELWEDLKLVYLYEEFGTKRSQVKKYVEYEMVEEKPVLEQIQEFNCIADSIVAAGMTIDEKFHVSVIISKLPPSWKDVFIKLIREEHLPFGLLMNHLRIEEEIRTQNKLGLSFNLIGHNSANKHASNIGDMNPPVIFSKDREREPESKPVVCHACGKKGHISRNCGKVVKVPTLEKLDGDNRSLQSTSEVNTANSVEYE